MQAIKPLAFPLYTARIIVLCIAKTTSLNTVNQLNLTTVKGAVHILGENCPRSDTDIAHMGQYLGPNKYMDVSFFIFVYYISVNM